MCPEKNNLFKTCLSAKTVVGRVDDIPENLLTQLSDKKLYFKWFSLVLNESIDISVTDTVQVLLFIWEIDKNYKVC